MKKWIWFFALLGCCQLVFALPLQTILAFEGGINVSRVQFCQRKYTSRCPVQKSNPLVQGLVQQDACMKKKMTKDRLCLQILAIQDLTGYFPNQIRKYGRVVVFRITTLADGINQFYIVDTAGHFIPLKTEVKLDQDETYQHLKRSYGAISLTQELYWKKTNEDLFPDYQPLSNKNMQLIFHQVLKSEDCVSCEVIGVASLAYEFNSKGVFKNIKLMGIRKLIN